MNASFIAIPLLILVVVGLPLAILLKSKHGSKRGCGRGCATCGNRHICHGTGAYKDAPYEGVGVNSDQKS